MLDKVIELQTNAVKRLEEALNRNQKELTFKSPTGSGKTFIMAKLMDSMLSKHDDIVFIVSSLSKAKLAEQNHNKFKSFLEHGYVKNIKPCLISSEKSGENSLYIPTSYNVYSLPRDLYRDKSKLKDQQALIRFIRLLTDKKIYLIKDECHIATKNLDELSEHFYKVLNVSATPKGKPDVEISEIDAVAANLIKTVKFTNTSFNSFNVEDSQYDELSKALEKFIAIKGLYHKHNINPCFIIQISNAQAGSNELQSVINLLTTPRFKDLKYISVANDPKLCSTNDMLIKANPSKWEKYAVQNDSLIDVIIFKMKITEGWDIPRACMLFQIRDSKSKQLDEQVLGRVRRNPLLLEFEKINEKDRELLTTAYVWGIKEQDKSDNHTVPVKLKGNVPLEIANVKNQIQDEIRILTTRLKDLTSMQNEFDIQEFLDNADQPLATTNIFDLYEELNNSTNDIKRSCDTYCSSKSNYYNAWFAFNNNLKEIKIRSKKVLSDYESSMEIVTDLNGDYMQYTISFDSLYCSNKNFPLSVNDWIWDNDDQYGNFEFDSEAERKWLDSMLRYFAVKTVTIGDREIKLLGKNFIVNSNIKYQYYSNGVHDSYPDFIMKDPKNRYFLFEVKSLNTSSVQNINNTEYIDKIKTLKNLYFEVSKLLDYYFCLPVLKGNDWNIYVFHNGEETSQSLDELKTLINT